MILKVSREKNQSPLTVHRHVEKLLRGQASKMDARGFDSSAPQSSQGNRFSSLFVYISMGREVSADSYSTENIKFNSQTREIPLQVLKGSEAVYSAQSTLANLPNKPPSGPVPSMAMAMARQISAGHQEASCEVVPVTLLFRVQQCHRQNTNHDHGN